MHVCLTGPVTEAGGGGQLAFGGSDGADRASLSVFTGGEAHRHSLSAAAATRKGIKERNKTYLSVYEISRCEKAILCVK